MAPDPLAYQHISIKDENGKEISFAWRQKSMWDDNNKLLILMIHPGRVKSGIHYMGPIFTEGKKFTITVQKGMKDMYRNELPADVVKTYTIGAEDRQLPRILSVSPQAKQGTQDAVEITFSEGMDRGCITQGMKLYDAKQQAIAYTLTDAGDDKTFILTPQHTWKKGKYSILLNRTVSDFAANRMNRPFEITDVKDIQKDEIEVRRYFDVK
jgi:methionine-rich copper-binding protein CopC